MSTLLEGNARASKFIEGFKGLIREAKHSTEHFNVNYDHIVDPSLFSSSIEGRDLYLWEYLLVELQSFEELPYEVKVECVLEIIKELSGSDLPVFELPLFSGFISHVINDDDNKVNRDVALKVYFFLYRYYREVKQIPDSFVDNATSIVQDLQDFVSLTGEAYNTEFISENVEEVFNGDYLDMIGASITVKMNDKHRDVEYTELQHGRAIRTVLSCIVFDTTKVNPKASQMIYKLSIELANLTLHALQETNSLPEQGTDKLKGISTDFRTVD